MQVRSTSHSNSRRLAFAWTVSHKELASSLPIPRVQASIQPCSISWARRMIYRSSSIIRWNKVRTITVAICRIKRQRRWAVSAAGRARMSKATRVAIRQLVVSLTRTSMWTIVGLKWSPGTSPRLQRLQLAVDLRLGARSAPIVARSSECSKTLRRGYRRAHSKGCPEANIKLIITKHTLI